MLISHLAHKLRPIMVASLCRITLKRCCKVGKSVGGLRCLTTFHSRDGLDSGQWVLIYHNKEYESVQNMLSVMVVFGVVSVLVLTFTLILVVPDLKDMKYEKSDWLFVGWPIGVGFVAWLLSRYRRRFVLRMYQQQSDQPTYCIVWLNWHLGKSRFIYHLKDTTAASEPHQAVAPLLGNFKARNRPWLVKSAYFDRPEDYFNVRVTQQVR